MNFYKFLINYINNLFFPALFSVGLIFSDSVCSQDLEKNFSINDCLILNLKGVNSDVAARMVKNACESKAQDFEKSKLISYELEYGGEVSFKAVSMTAWDYAGDKLNIRIKNEMPIEGPTLSYVRLSIGVPKYGEEYCSIKRIAAYKIHVKPGETQILNHPLFFPKSTKGICLDIEYARAKRFTWRDSLSFKNLTQNTEPLNIDPFKNASFPFFPQPAPAAALPDVDKSGSVRKNIQSSY